LFRIILDQKMQEISDLSPKNNKLHISG